MTAIRQQSEELQVNLHHFMRTIRALSQAQFTQPMNGWSPRDVVAHLIGWNRAAVDIVDSIRAGETPAVLIDPGDDFCDVNASFVQKYTATDMVPLLRELELSYQELARHLYTIDMGDWTREVAVPGWDDPTTIEENVQAIAGDYADHARAIEEWSAAVSTP